MSLWQRAELRFLRAPGEEVSLCIFSILSISRSMSLSPCPDGNTKLRARLSSSLICFEAFEVTFALWRERWRSGGCLVSPGCWREAVLELGAGPGHPDCRFLLTFLNCCHLRAWTQSHTVILVRRDLGRSLNLGVVQQILDIFWPLLSSFKSSLKLFL